jgi:hypothetical protein
MANRPIPPAILKEARRHPGEWVYEIVGPFGPDDPVPPEAIRGAWAVNDAGQIVGGFIPNPKYRANSRPRE